MATTRKEKSTQPPSSAENANGRIPPVKVFLVEDVSASIFAREHPVKGEMRTFYSVSFSRSYRDAMGKRKYIKSFNVEDLGKVISVAQQSDEHIRSLLKSENE